MEYSPESKMTDSALGSYVESAIRHGNAALQGDSRATNRAHDKVLSSWRRLRKATSEWPRVMKRLLTHEDSSVRGWAAVHLLRHYEAEALETLRVIATEQNVIGINAKIVLKLHAQGQLAIAE